MLKCFLVKKYLIIKNYDINIFFRKNIKYSKCLFNQKMKILVNETLL